MCGKYHNCITKCAKFSLFGACPGPPREIKGPGQRVKVGPQGQGGFQKGSLHADNNSSYTSPTISPYLLACYTATLKNTVTALLKYLDLTVLFEYIDLLNRHSKGSSWGLLGPLSGWFPGQNAPVSSPLLRAALAMPLY